MIALEEDIFAAAADSGTLAVVGGLAEDTALEFSEWTLVENEVADFENLVAASEGSVPSKFLDWLKGVKGTTWVNMGFQGAMLGIMLYPIIEHSIDKAKANGNRISLNSAIKGVKNTLQDNYDKTVLPAAQKCKDDPNAWGKLTKDQQNELEGQLALTGELYWTLHAADIMVAMAKMPIYDPTSVAPALAAIARRQG